MIFFIILLMIQDHLITFERYTINRQNVSGEFCLTVEFSMFDYLCVTLLATIFVLPENGTNGAVAEISASTPYT